MLTGLLRASVAVIVVSALACLASHDARAVDPEPAALSPTMERALAWLPETTETIVVGQSFTIPAADRAGAADPTSERPEGSLQSIIPGMLLGELNEPEMEKYLKPLAGRTVLLAVRGGRNYELVSASLPKFRAEGCAIVIFDNDLGEAGEEWVNTLRAGAKEVRKLAGRSVFVFPPTKSMHAARKPEWPGKLGIYLAMVNSDTILCATSDDYLEQLLDRIDMPRAKRALPADLREWKHVNPAAAAWMLRHSAIQRERPQVIEGVTWTLTEDNFQAVYVAVAGAEENAARVVQRNWQPAMLDLRPTIERLENGSIVVTSKVKNLSLEAAFGLALQVHWLEAESGRR